MPPGFFESPKQHKSTKVFAMDNYNFTSLNDISTDGQKGPKRKATNAGLFITLSESKKSTVRSTAIVFSLLRSIAEEYRLIHGDRVEVGYDAKAKTGIIRRVRSGGHSIRMDESPNARARVRLTWKPEMQINPPEEGIECESVAVESAGILFTIPN